MLFVLSILDNSPFCIQLRVLLILIYVEGLHISGIVDPPLIHQLMRLVIKNMWRKSGFRVLENSSSMKNGFVWSCHLFFYFFFKWGKLSKNKNPSMTPVKKKRSTKLDFWVRELGYLLGRYLMRDNTPLGPGFGFY